MEAKRLPCGSICLGRLVYFLSFVLNMKLLSVLLGNIWHENNWAGKMTQQEKVHAAKLHNLMLISGC